MIDKKLNEIRSNLKQAFPEISNEIDNLIGNLIEDSMDPEYHGSLVDDLKQDLEYTLNAHNVSYDSTHLNVILK